MKKLLFAMLLFSAGAMYAVEPAPIEAPKEKSFFLWTEAYYWRIHEAGVGFVYDDPDPVFKAPGYAAGGDLLPAKFDWHPGFRVGIGYRISPNYWTVEASYSYYRSADHRKVLRNVGFQLYPAFPVPVADEYTMATSYIRITANFADILMKKTFHPVQNIDLCFANGMGSIWIEQNWKIAYLTETNIEHRIKPKWAYKGAGPKLGLTADWLCGKGFAVTGKGTICAMMGNYDNRTSFKDYNRNTQVMDVKDLFHFDDFRIVTHYNLLLGGSWQHNFKHVDFKILAAFELNVWDNVNEIDSQIFKTPNAAMQSLNIPYRMAMQGLTVGLYFGF